ncbi:MAG: hypothetical protein M3454_05820 [Actinomycetota bacterium]|nr:hypothetical protein [Actinomycetota bacterium]
MPFTVALIGPDGAGKSSISKELASRLGYPTKSIYMGVNLEASRVMLPTTRLVLAAKRARGRRPEMTGTPDPAVVAARRGRMANLKSTLRLTNWMAEEWFRQSLAWYHLRRGRMVIFDRHFFCDYHAYDVAPSYGPRPLINRIHGQMLKRLYPRPELTILLDASTDILLARKQEAPPDFLERRRAQYRNLSEVLPHFVAIDASKPLDEVVESVAAEILGHMRLRLGIEQPKEV